MWTFTQFQEDHQCLWLSVKRNGKSLSWYQEEVLPHPDLWMTDLGIPKSAFRSEWWERWLKLRPELIHALNRHRQTLHPIPEEETYLRPSNFHDLDKVVEIYDYNGYRLPPMQLDARQIDQMYLDFWLSALKIKMVEDRPQVTFLFRVQKMTLFQRPLLLSELTPERISWFEQNGVLRVGILSEIPATPRDQLEKTLVSSWEKELEAVMGKCRIQTPEPARWIYRWDEGKHLYQLWEEESEETDLTQIRSVWSTLSLDPSGALKVREIFISTEAEAPAPRMYRVNRIIKKPSLWGQGLEL